MQNYSASFQDTR
jgi:hypothetical protein